MMTSWLSPHQFSPTSRGFRGAGGLGRNNVALGLAGVSPPRDLASQLLAGHLISQALEHPCTREIVLPSKPSPTARPLTPSYL